VENVSGAKNAIGLMKQFNIDQPEVLHTSLENFYLDLSKRRSILSDGRILYSSTDSKNYNMFDYYNDFCKGTFIENYTKPYIMLHACFSMPWFEQILYNKETQDYLNDKGLDIFLMEPLSFYEGSKKRFYRDLLITPDDGIEFDQWQTIFTNTNIMSFELDSISNYVDANKLTNVTVYVEEFDSKDFLEHRYPNLRIETLGLLLKTYKNKLSDYNLPNNLDEKLEHRLLCTNWRYEPHRHIVAAYLYDKDCLLSWNYRYNFNYLQERLWFNIDNNIIKTNCEKLSQNPPGPIDDEPVDLNICPTTRPLPANAYLKTFCSVINEPYFAYPFGLYSEKVINASILKRPFIIVGPPHTLKYLQDQGYQTFSKWWDESYDDIEDHQERLLKIFTVFDYINNLSLSEIKKIYNEMKSVLDHNSLIL